MYSHCVLLQLFGYKLAPNVGRFGWDELHVTTPVTHRYMSVLAPDETAVTSYWSYFHYCERPVVLIVPFLALYNILWSTRFDSQTIIYICYHLSAVQCLEARIHFYGDIGSCNQPGVGFNDAATWSRRCIVNVDSFTQGIRLKRIK